MSCKPSQCPGLLGRTPTRAKTQERQETSQGATDQNPPNVGHRLTHLRPPTFGVGTVLGPGLGRLLPLGFLSDSSCWLQLGDPRSPLLTSAAITHPKSGVAPRPARRGSGCGRLGHFEVRSWATNSAPSVAGGELRQLRDCLHRRRRFNSAASDIGRRQPGGSRGGGSGARRVGVGTVAIAPGGV